MSSRADDVPASPGESLQSPTPAPTRRSRTGRLDRGSRDHLAGGVAGALAAFAFAMSGVLRSTYPFGEASRSLGDLSHQIIPMYAHHRDVVLGQAPGDLFVNWSSAFGVGYLGDYMTYVGTTLSWIAVLLPRDSVDLAAYLMTVAALAIAAWAMTVFLRRVRPTGPQWLAVASGLSYALCGWAVDDGSYVTMWLTGLAAFPILCLLGEWVVSTRSVTSFLVSPLVVALLWTSNFYTVYMATIGAGLVVLARLLSVDGRVSWRWRLSGGMRFVVAVCLGIGLAAPLLVPTFRAARNAQPSPDAVFVPIDWLSFASRLLPGTEGVGSSPGLAVGTVLLLLALSLPFNRAVALRERAIWSAVVLLVGLSMQVGPTQAMWHGFDIPNGSAFRQAFVLAGLLVIAGWLSGAAGLAGARVVIPPVLLLGTLYAAAAGTAFMTPTTRIVVPVVAGLFVVGWFAFGRPGLSGPGAAQRRQGAATSQGQRVVVTAAVLVVVVEMVAATTAVDEARAGVLSVGPRWGDDHDTIRSLVLDADQWPVHRTSPGAHLTVNDPLLLGGQGGDYYSSTIPAQVSTTMTAFGFGYSGYGRALVDPGNPVTDAIFSVGSRVVPDAEDPTDGAGYRLVERAHLPLVRVSADVPWTSTDPVPFGTQETALGADVYEVPELTIDQTGGTTVSASGDTLTIAPGSHTTDPMELQLQGRCRPGSEIFLYGPLFVGDVLVDGDWTPLLPDGARRPGIYTSAALKPIGTTPPDGVVDVALRVRSPARLPRAAVGCLDHDMLQAAITAQNAATDVSTIDVGNHSVDAVVSAGRAGTIVIGVARTPGWQCAVGDGDPQTPRTLAGLIAVPVDPDETRVSCSFRPPGLRMGLALGVISLAAVVAGALVLMHWRARVRYWEST